MSIDQPPHLSLWLPWIGLGLLLGTSAVSLALYLLKLRAGIAVEPPSLQGFEVDELSVSVRRRLQSAAAQLASLGFTSLGKCKWLWNARINCYACIWVRDDIIAEIAIYTFGRSRRDQILIALGQEYTDGSSLIVNNQLANRFGLRDGVFGLRGVSDISKLDEVLRAIISNRRGDRVAWIPTDAIQYKNNEIRSSLEELVQSGQYVMNSERNRLVPTRKCVWRTLCWWILGGNTESFRLTHGAERELDRLLKELGFTNLKALRKPRIGAFPVIADAKSFTETSSNGAPSS